MIIYESIQDRSDFINWGGEIIEKSHTIRSHIVYFTADGSPSDYIRGEFYISRDTIDNKPADISYDFGRLGGDNIECDVDENNLTIDSVQFELFLATHWDSVVNSDDFHDLICAGQSPLDLIRLTEGDKYPTEDIPY